MAKANANQRTRTLIVWEIPAVQSPSFVEMYINPNNLAIQDNKLQSTTKTKGGYILQYWGEELSKITLTGDTGDGGVEAVNVIRDIYRSEQIALASILLAGASTKRRQSLAQLATSVVMWYQGQGYRGFFTAFSTTETPSGVITYTLNFTVVETLGRRSNFLPWQRKPWSTLENPSTTSGLGGTTGGGYGTNFKIGEMNAPLEDPNGLLSDPVFSKRTETPLTPGTVQGNRLRTNLNENLPSPSQLFANGTTRTGRGV